MSYSVSFLLITVLFRPTTGISGGFRAHYQTAAQGIVLIDNGFGLKYPPFCAGALISSQIVLTNGNCCTDGPLDNTRITVGALRTFSQGHFFLVDDYLIIGNSHSSHYQLCVIRLDREVVFQDSPVIPLALPSAADTIMNSNNIVYTFGYGSVQLDKKMPWQEGVDPDLEPNPIYQRVLSSDLMAINLPLQENWACEKFFGVPYTGDWRLHCLGFTNDRTKRLMFDDNGAPLVEKHNHVVYGIAATFPALLSGFNWQTDSFPNYFIDVKSARKDIISAMRFLMDKD